MSNADPGAPHDLEHELASLTDWPSQGGGLWQSALTRMRPTAVGPGSRTSLRQILTRPLGTGVLVPALLLVVIGAIALGVLLPSLGKARRSAVPMAAERAAESKEPLRLGRDLAGGINVVEGMASPPPATDLAASGGAQANWKEITQQPSAPPLDRQVVRKATIDLRTHDVAATFLKACLVISEAQGEYIENSSLSGEERPAAGDGPEGNPTEPMYSRKVPDRQATANITLRVQASRLSDVLNQLRRLGTVVSETATGEDVTDHVVDLEARLRNEQRVETELLELLSSRKGAPLTELLQLREQLRTIRESIERLVAQRDRLGRMVSLATVLVVIRADDAPAPTSGKGIGAYFGRALGEAWRSSMRFLADSAALIVSVIVGGAIWWALLAAAITAVVAARRRVVRAAAVEPVPVE